MTLDEGTMEELWKPYARLNGYVEISNKARVKNPKTGKILKQFKNKSTGYLCLAVKPNGRNGKGSLVRVHRAFAETWIPNPNKHPCVNHKDGVKTNNTFENLEWCTYSENTKHAIEMGLLSYPKKERKLSKQQINQVSQRITSRSRTDGYRAIARELGVSHSCLIRTLKARHQLPSYPPTKRLPLDGK